MLARSGSPTKIGLCLPLAYPSPRQRLGKQKASRRTPFIRLKSLRDLGAGEGIRTLDPNLGKLVLYLPARLRRYSKASHVARRLPQNSEGSRAQLARRFRSLYVLISPLSN